MSLENIILLYFSFYVVMILHELGHFPEKIKIKWGIIPTATAMRSKYRLGGLVVNAIIFVGVFLYNPQQTFILYMGLIAWAHFIFYMIAGSIIPEARVGDVNVKTHVFDDVPNEYAFFFILTGIISFIALKEFYIPILQGVFA